MHPPGRRARGHRGARRSRARHHARHAEEPRRAAAGFPGGDPGERLRKAGSSPLVREGNNPRSAFLKVAKPLLTKIPSKPTTLSGWEVDHMAK